MSVPDGNVIGQSEIEKQWLMEDPDVGLGKNDTVVLPGTVG